MSTSEQVSFLNSLYFKSQMILMQEAAGELDKICNQAADKAEFDVLYEKYKHKYGDYHGKCTDSGSKTEHFREQ